MFPSTSAARQPRRSRDLARALEGLVRAAERWPTLVPGCWPVFDPRLELAELRDELGLIERELDRADSLKRAPERRASAG